MQGLWTDGRFALTVGLDQRLHCWQLSHSHVTKSRNRQPTVPQHKGGAALDPSSATQMQSSDHEMHSRDAASGASVSGRNESTTNACLFRSTVTQVLEPAALDAVYDSRTQTYHVLVAGRGTQLLVLQDASHNL